MSLSPGELKEFINLCHALDVLDAVIKKTTPGGLRDAQLVLRELAVARILQLNPDANPGLINRFAELVAPPEVDEFEVPLQFNTKYALKPGPWNPFLALPIDEFLVPRNNKKGDEQPMANEQVNKKTVEIVEVLRHGEKMIIPDTVDIDTAIASLQRKQAEESQVVAIREEFDAFIWDGAYAAEKVAQSVFGYMTAEDIPGVFIFPPEHPTKVSIETDWQKTENINWGRFTVPGIDGWFQTSHTKKNNRFVFQLTGEVRKRYEGLVKKYADAIRDYLLTDSIYKGKAFEIVFTNEDGKPDTLPKPRFLNLSEAANKELIYSAEVDAAIKHNLFAPIEHTAECRKYSIPLKRGVLLAGPYGTGKTLAAFHTAVKAHKNNWTFIYCPKTEDLAETLRFAAQYTPAVVFCEDVDRVMAGESRSDKMDEVLNTLDGVGSKSTEIITVLTTNHLETINRAMLRPGRIDALVSVLPPDAEAVQRLLHLYGRGLIRSNEDLTAVGKELEGEIPAVIAEVVEKAKLAAIYNHSDAEFHLTGADLHSTAVAMREQRRILRDKPQEATTPFQQFGVEMGAQVAAGMLKLGTTPSAMKALERLMNLDAAEHDCDVIGDSATELAALRS